MLGRHCLPVQPVMPTSSNSNIKCVFWVCTARAHEVFDFGSGRTAAFWALARISAFEMKRTSRRSKALRRKGPKALTGSQSGERGQKTPVVIQNPDFAPSPLGGSVGRPRLPTLHYAA
jgi:hypothetical protein